MKWLEIIELRSVRGQPGELRSELLKLVDALKEETERGDVTAFSRVMIDTDFSIHLFHDSTKIAANGTPLGLRLASALKEFGMVNHTVWLEMPGRQNCFEKKE